MFFIRHVKSKCLNEYQEVWNPCSCKHDLSERNTWRHYHSCESWSLRRNRLFRSDIGKGLTEQEAVFESHERPKEWLQGPCIFQFRQSDLYAAPIKWQKFMQLMYRFSHEYIQTSPFSLKIFQIPIGMFNKLSVRLMSSAPRLYE